MQFDRLPPPIDTKWLLAALKDKFPAHKGNPEMQDLLDELVNAYSTWWLLMSKYPERRIVAIAPVWAVREIHAEDLELFFADCFDYLGKIPVKKDIWGGAMDFRGTYETASTIEEAGIYAGLPWQPIMRVARGDLTPRIVRTN
jgi:hypothetical protein